MDNHIKNLQVALSNCCKAPIKTVEQTTVEMILRKIESSCLCTKCNELCFRDWFPVYKYIGEGSYRKIDYSLKKTENESN